MKQVLLMRHSKSAWDQAGLSDHQRSLNQRGKRDAPLMGLIIKEKQLIPSYVFSSDSQRTIETLAGLEESLGKLDIRLESNLYLASSQEIIAQIRACSLAVDRIMILAHNPGITEAVMELSGHRLDNVPTSGVALIEFAVDEWKEVEVGVLKTFFYPKMFI